MKRLISTILIILFFVAFSNAQKDTAYVRTFGGISKDVCYDIIATSDNGLAMVGSTSSFGNGTSSFYLIKTDSNGTKQWSATYGGDNIDVATAIKQTADKGYIIAGYTLSFGNGGYDYYLVKTDSLGKQLWQKTFGGNDWEFANGIEITADGGFMLCGNTYSDTYGGSDIFIVCTNSSGDSLWTKKYGGTENEDAKGIITTSDKNFIVVGETASKGNSNGKEDAYVLKITPSGDTIFTRTYGGPEYDGFCGVDTARNGDFLFIGATKNFSATSQDTYVVRTDKDGMLLWGSTYGAANSARDEFGYKIKELPNGQILTVGATYSTDNNGNAGMHILRLAKEGFWIAGPVFGTNEDEKGYALTLTKSNAVVYAGYTRSYGVGNEDVYMVKIKNSDIVMEYILNIKTTKDNLPTISVKKYPLKSTVVSVAPNPFNDNSTVYFNDLSLTSPFSFSVYDILGKKVLSIDDMRQNQYKLKAIDFNKGVYIYKVSRNGVPLAEGKMVVY